jgi:hypothetical protein
MIQVKLNRKPSLTPNGNSHNNGSTNPVAVDFRTSVYAGQLSVSNPAHWKETIAKKEITDNGQIPCHNFYQRDCKQIGWPMR